MNIKNILGISILMCLFPLHAIASEANERIYLLQMMNQLEAMKPLLIAAAKEQNKNSRLQFHYMAYRDFNGKLQNGLLEDINEIKNGIQDKLNDSGNEPRHFQAIKGDYLNLVNIKLGSVEKVRGSSNDK
jgi:RAQPRD family integrative conjugative element protein